MSYIPDQMKQAFGSLLEYAGFPTAVMVLPDDYPPLELFESVVGFAGAAGGAGNRTEVTIGWYNGPTPTGALLEISEISVYCAANWGIGHGLGVGIGGTLTTLQFSDLRLGQSPFFKRVTNGAAASGLYIALVGNLPNVATTGITRVPGRFIVDLSEPGGDWSLTFRPANDNTAIYGSAKLRILRTRK